MNTWTDVTDDSLSHIRTGFILTKSIYSFSSFQNIRTYFDLKFNGLQSNNWPSILKRKTQTCENFWKTNFWFVLPKVSYKSAYCICGSIFLTNWLALHSAGVQLLSWKFTLRVNYLQSFLTDKIAGRYENVGNFQVALERRQDGGKGNFITGLTHDV